MKACTFVKMAVLSAVACLSQLAEAVPACPEPFEAKQSDGTVVQIHLRGDEFLSWHEDVNGYSVVQDEKSRDWCYAALSPDGATLIPTSSRVGSPMKSMPSVKHLLPTPALQSAQAAKAERMAANAQRASTLRTSGTVKQLVILVQFKDVKLTKTKAQFESLFNQIGYAGEGNQGSVRDYYREVSHGKIDVQSVVVGPVTLDKTYAYYGANLGTTIDVNGSELGADALAALSETGFSDWSQFDLDGDGWFDELDIIHAGRGEEAGSSASNLWSCRWSWRYPYYFAMYGGLKFGGFHYEPELRGTDSSAQQITQVGVICHEFGHSLGLPDLYDTDYSSEGAGNFCLMAGGSWGCYGTGSSGTCPVHMSPWCKQQLGWITPTEISAAGMYALPAVEEDGKVYKLKGNFSSSSEFFLLENRTATGFDRGLPGTNKGMLIWHVDNAMSNNKDESHYMVDLEEASGTQHLERSGYGRGDDSDYFRSTTKTSFTSTTTPNNKSYSGTALGLNISGISAAGSSMTFTVTGGETPISVPDAPRLSIGTYGSSSAKASYIELTWGTVAGATSYDVYRAESSASRPSTPIARGVTSPYRDYASTSGLLAGKKYYYWVSAVNAAGASYSNSDWGNTAIQLTLDKSTIAFSEAGGSATVSVSSDVGWTVTQSGSWFSFTSGSGAVSVTAPANPNETARSGSLTVKAGADRDYPVTRTVSVTQEPKTSLPEFVIVNHVLVGYNGRGGTVTIPSEAWEIGASVFANNASLTGLVLHGGLTKIGDNAFYGCTSLRSVTFVEGLVEIGNWAFENSGVTSISLPNSLRMIGKSAFFGCGSLSSASLGTGVQTVKYGAFYGCTSLTSIDIPNSVTSLDTGSTFSYCTGLAHVAIGSGVLTIPENCFFGCTALAAVAVPSTVRTLSFRAFYGCTSLSEVSLANGVQTIGENAFDACTALGSFVVPASVTVIGNYAFTGCASLTNVTYLGNAPTVQPGIYRATPTILVSHVPTGTTGWNGMPGSATLPSVFPSNGGVDARAIVRPDLPTKPVATILTRGANANRDYIEVSWGAVGGVTSYSLYRSTTGTRPASPIASSIQSPYHDTVAQSGLRPGVKYYYWVEARNAYGSAFSDAVWGEILAINPPSAPVITSAVGDETGVTLVWSPAAGADTYRVYRSTVASQNGEEIASGLTGCTFFDDTCEPGIDCWYRVSAVNEGGDAISTEKTAYRTILLSTDPDRIALPASGTGRIVSIATGSEWMASASDSWISLSVIGDELTVFASANVEYTPRSGVVTVVAGAGTDHPASVTIAVTQTAAEPPPDLSTGLVSGLKVRRYWPEMNSKPALDCEFTLTLDGQDESVPVEFRVVDADYRMDVTDGCFICEIGDGEEVYFSSGDELTAGRKRFVVYYYDCMEGSRALQVSVRAGDDDWVEADAVRVVFGDAILASGTESFWNGTTEFTTNTAKMAEGWYDFDLQPAHFGEEDTISGVYVCNASNLVVEEGRILTNTVWTADRIHYLRGDVVVPSGVSLTIANGALVKSGYYSYIFVEEGGVVNLQGVEFQRVGLADLPPNVRGENSVSGGETLVFASEDDNAIIGTIEGGDLESDFAFVYTYTRGEVVGRLPVPDETVFGCTFGGWETLDDEPIGENAVIEEGAFGLAGDAPYSVWARSIWIPARPTNIHVELTGAEIPEELYGWRAVLSWDAVLSDGVTDYEVAVLRAGEEPREEDWDTTGGYCEFTLWDIPYDYGIHGGEQVCCRVRAATDSEKGEATEFVFTLPLVLDLSKQRETVGEYGGAGDVSVSANVGWNVTSEAAWLQVVQTDATSFRYEVPVSDTPFVREGVIRVTGGDVTRTFTVVQGGNPECVTQTATPVIDPMDGTAFIEASCPVTISCDTADAAIYYTLDGSTPSAQSGMRYVGSFSVTSTTTIRAIAVKSGLTDSAIAKSTLTKLSAQEDGDLVTITVGGGKSVQIPKSWFDAYPTLRAQYPSYEAMALAMSGKRDAAGNALFIWQDFVAGTDPTNPASRFKVTSFKFENGRINVSWDPDLNENGTKALRAYRVFGSETLASPVWSPVETDTPDARFKFFKVTVDMP